MVNEQVEEIFGFSKEELHGRPVEMLLPPETHERHIAYRAEFMRMPQERRMADGLELYGQHKNGRPIPVDVGLNPVRMGSETCILAAIVDVTEQKKANDAINTANEVLQKSNQELEQFAYVASHDLQEPLRKMSSYSQLLLDECGDKLDEDGREYLGIVIDGASRLKSLVTDLLVFSRINSRGEALAATNATQCLEIAKSNLELLLNESDAEVSSTPLPAVIADESQLIMLFQNLINNAVKYCENPPRIRIGGRDLEHGSFEFFVRDNGIGIEPQYFDKIFGIFKRLHSRNEYSGTGIGLANCKRIVERFGGTIWVDSTPGEGSVFYFTIKKASSKEPTWMPSPVLQDQ